MKDFQTSDFDALIGIDWADKKHDICVFDQHHKTQSYQVIQATPEAIHQWATALQQQYPGGRVAIGCELTKGPLVYALEQYEHIVVFPINPTTVAKYREAFTHSGAKDDPSDAYCQVEILQNHLAKLKPITPESPKMRSLSRLVAGRRKLVQNRVNLSNHITVLLKNYYPQVLQWFTDKDTIIFCDFIAKWPSLEDVQRARPTTLRKFFNEHNARNSASNEQRIEAIKTAIPLTRDAGIIEPNQMLVGMLINQLRVLITSIEQLDREIKQRYRKEKDRAIFDSFPGAGPQLAPRLLVAFGTQRDRYETAADLQKYAGIAPVLERSGQKSWIHWRYSCPKFLRQTFIEWAGQSVRFSFWAKAYYHQQIDRGKTHNMAIRSLAFKWIRIAFRCWKNNTPYDETRYLEALKSKGSPLLEYALK